MDISALVAPLVAQVAQKVFSPPPLSASKSVESMAFDKLMVDESKALLRSKSIHEWPAVREAIAASKDHQPYALSIDADGSLFVLGKDGSRYRVELDQNAQEVLLESYGTGPHPIEIPLENQRPVDGSQRPLHFDQRLK